MFDPVFCLKLSPDGNTPIEARITSRPIALMYRLYMGAALVKLDEVDPKVKQEYRNYLENSE